MADDLEELRGLLRQASERAERVRLPSGWYSREGDCVYFFNEDVPYRGERVDDLLTLYRVRDGERIIGAQVKGIRRLPKYNRLVLKVFQSGVVEIVLLFLLTYDLMKTEKPEEEATRESKYNEAIQALRGKVPISPEDLVGV